MRNSYENKPEVITSVTLGAIIRCFLRACPQRPVSYASQGRGIFPSKNVNE